MQNIHSVKITSEMEIIDIISQHSETEKIFKRLEVETNECICCQGLFLTLKEASERFIFDLDSILIDINATISKEQQPSGVNDENKTSDQY